MCLAVTKIIRSPHRGRLPTIERAIKGPEGSAEWGLLGVSSTSRAAEFI